MTLVAGDNTPLVTVPSQLVKNGGYKDVDRESSRFVSQEVFDLCRATKLMDITRNFISKEFTAALQHLKLGNAPGPDSISWSLYSMLKQL